MTLLDEFTAKVDAERVNLCKVHLAIVAGAEDLEALLASIGKVKGFTVAKVLQFLQDKGFDLNEKAIYKHRKGACGCAK